MSSVESLFSLSIQVFASVAIRNIILAETLPWHVKTVLLKMLGGRDLLSPPTLRILCHPDIEKLDLAGSSISDASLKIISKCTKLSILCMPNAFVTLPALLKIFVQLSNLRELIASSCPALEDQVLTVIGCCCSKLAVLDVSKCPGVGNNGMKALANLNHLGSLDISYTSVGDEGLKSLCEGKTRNSLVELKLNSCPRITPEISSSIALLQKLQYLSFLNCPMLMDSRWMEAFENLPMARNLRRFRQLSFTMSTQ